MQTLVNQLQNIIQKHYGLSSQLELKKSSIHSKDKFIYSEEERTLSIPLIDPISQSPIALFKVNDVKDPQDEFIGRISDLVQITLQSYIDLIEKMDTTENLIQYLQMELNPEKIIRLKKESKKVIHTGTVRLGPQNEKPVNTSPFHHKEILLLCKSREILDSLSVHIHDVAKNNFFIRTDHMPEQFLTRINDLIGLEKTTLFIPQVHLLSAVQQKTLETYFIMEKSKASSLVVLAGTHLTMSELIKQHQVSPSLLKHLHLFHLMSGDLASNNSRNFEALSQCASAVLGMNTTTISKKSGDALSLTKSYNLIPSLEKFTPTLH